LAIAVEGEPPTGRFVFMPYRTRRQLFLVLMAAPAVIYVVLVALWPLCQGIYYSFFDYNLIRPQNRTFEGLGNYVRLWSDDTARAALVNTFVFTIGAVTVEFAFGLGIAFLLWRDDLFNRICLSLLLIPTTVTPLVVGLIFKAMLNADYGVLGYFLTEAGLSGEHGLLGETSSAFATLIAIDAWEWTPLMALILLAGLKSLPADILEAALVDGAGSA
jgi:multiple sugar transport system permease protein